MIPDAVTMNPDYIRRFGVHVTGVEELDRDLANHMTTVKIPIIKIMAYYEEGIVVQIPSREDMITMHKNIDLYLTEWTEYLRVAINHDDTEHKALISGLDNLSKLIYNKAAPNEVIDNLFTHRKFGLTNPLEQAMQQKQMPSKPDYNSIADLLKKRQKASRF